MKKLIALLTLAALPLMAGDTAFFDLTRETQYSAREFSVQTFYVLKADELGSLDRVRGHGTGIGATWYQTEAIGAAVSTLISNDLGDGIVDEFRGGLRYRIPFERLAVYGIADIAYDLRRSDTIYIAGAGLQYRVTGAVSAIAELTGDFDSQSGDDIRMTFGLSLGF